MRVQLRLAPYAEGLDLAEDLDAGVRDCVFGLGGFAGGEGGGRREEAGGGGGEAAADGPEKELHCECGVSAGRCVRLMRPCSSLPLF